MISPLCCIYLGYALPPTDRPPWLRDFYCCYGFFPGLVLLYDPPGMGDCKVPYALTVPLPVCTYGTQYGDATQHTKNHACSRTLNYFLCDTLRVSHRKFTGRCHNCGKHGHKAVEYWSGGKTPCSNQCTPYQ